jgi:hypothetical protein
VAYKSSKQVLTAAILHGLAGILMFATVILFGIDGRRRDWMMNWQFNWFGWSFKVAIVACILHIMTAIIAGYQGANKYEEKYLFIFEKEKEFFCSRCLYDMYDYERAHEELENRSTLKFPPLPMYPSRPSSERGLSSNGGSKTHLHQYT